MFLWRPLFQCFSKSASFHPLFSSSPSIIHTSTLPPAQNTIQVKNNLACQHNALF